VGWEQTRSSLLLRVRDLEDSRAWGEFAQVYTPVVKAYARCCGVPEQELDDVVQEVLWAASQLIGDFQHDPQTRPFRPWLRSVTHHRIQKWRRGLRRAPVQPEDSQIIESLTDSDADLEKCWDREWAKHVLVAALARAQQHFAPRTSEVFRQVVILQRPPAEVAAEFGMKIQTVYVYKARVLDRLRQEVEGLEG